MIISSTLDFREAARRRLPRFLFEYADGGANNEYTLRRNESARALPAIADAVGDRLTVLADSGVRSGLDVVRMLALGAKGILLGRAWVYALAARGEAGVNQLLDLIACEMRVAMTLIGAQRIADISRTSLVGD